MGIDASYQRIPAASLDALIADYTPAAVEAFLEHPPEYPFGTGRLGLHKFFDWIHDILTAQPGGNVEILQQVVAGGTSFQYGPSKGMGSLGLGDIRYLRPEEAAEIAHALASLRMQELLEKYLSKRDQTHLQPDKPPYSFADFIGFYGAIFEFFQLASDAGDGILLYLW